MSRTTRLLPLIALGAATAVALAGCVTTGSLREHDGMTIVTGDQARDRGDEGAIEGVLALTRGQCVGLEQPDGDVALVVWPFGTDWTGDQVATASGTFRFGETVTGGRGEFVDADAAVTTELQERCNADGTQVAVMWDIRH